MITSFDLHQLGWHDFQSLCRTVAREVLGQTLIAFADGRDAGRDGAFYGNWKKEGGNAASRSFVLQAKHTRIRDKTLIPSMLTDEFEKAEKLAQRGLCDVYVLMTNAKLTEDNEKQIVARFRKAGAAEVHCLGAAWFDETIAENKRLRMLVPRLYGLGDLTQILDSRAYEQASAILESMATDLAKLVRTSTYERSAQALRKHGLVLLMGAPMTGKTTIAAHLAISSADVYDTEVVKLTDAATLENRWNPGERQLFWLDDAFGDTQIRSELVHAWKSAMPTVRAAIARDCRFVLTCRDYVFRAAEPMLKSDSLSLLADGEVVVDVSNLSMQERRQVLYNHLEHGNQDRRFISQLLPFLDGFAEHPGFTPELARRLSEPQFTKQIHPVSREALDRFLAEPRELLLDVFRGLDPDSIAAIGLIFAEGNWLASPVRLSDTSAELVERLGGTLPGVIRSLESLDGSLVAMVRRDGEAGWTFAHPTMSDAFSDYARRPELLHLVLDKMSPRALLRRTVCGDVPITGSLMIPRPLWPTVAQRLSDPPEGPDRSGAEDRRDNYLAHNCSAQFLAEYFEQRPNELERLGTPKLMLDACASNHLTLTLHEHDLLPEPVRARFASRLIDFCVDGDDFGVLTDDEFRSMLTDDEMATLRSRLRASAFPRPRQVFEWHVGIGSIEEDREYWSAPIEEFAEAIDAHFPNDAEASEFSSALRRLRADYVHEGLWDAAYANSTEDVRAPAANDAAASSDRSVFDDLLDDEA
ncbi:hypothetical protein [Candidatus Poriferisodalis sp.]|uniref:nSTAND3 domain-containing NTPase n=1 Tax=Candidatus Poriferisodalis sp. TaxID=3101277 RepID=UPI003B018809